MPTRLRDNNNRNVPDEDVTSVTKLDCCYILETTSEIMLLIDKLVI